jgi:hypothetical protein
MVRHQKWSLSWAFVDTPTCRYGPKTPSYCVGQEFDSPLRLWVSCKNPSSVSRICPDPPGGCNSMVGPCECIAAPGRRAVLGCPQAITVSESERVEVDPAGPVASTV